MVDFGPAPSSYPDEYLTFESDTCRVRVIADSVSPSGKRLTTFELRYWRAFHAEFMTHKWPSRNASSSRAIPVSRFLKQLWNNPAHPIHWGAAQTGMQAYAELTGWRLKAAKAIWFGTGKLVAMSTWLAFKIGGAKQWVNRMGEPWQYITVIATATEWAPILKLRDHPMAQPEFQELASFIRQALDISVPTLLNAGEWHTPYVSPSETYGPGHPDVGLRLKLDDRLRASVARCARVSYLNHDGTQPTIAKDISLYDTLSYNDPPHASPLEHQAVPMPANSDGAEQRYANFIGFKNYRTCFEQGRGCAKSS